MKFKIGTNVVVKPEAGGEFLARIVDFVNSHYIVEDQDSDFFSVDETEIEVVSEQ